MMRSLLHRVLPVLLPIGSVLLLGASRSHQAAQSCASVQVDLGASADNFFLSLDSVRSVIGVGSENALQPLSVQSLEAVEGSLLKTQYVARAEAIWQPTGAMSVAVELKAPIARIMPASGGGYYLDKQGSRIPLSRHFASRCLIVRGNVLDEESNEDTTGVKGSELLPLLSELYSDPFWQAFFSEVVVSRSGELTLHSAVSQLKVEFGRPVRINDKLLALRAFIQDVMKHKGWDAYRSVSVKYRNQVVATR